MLSTPAFSELYIAGQVGGAFPGKWTNNKGTGLRGGETFSDIQLSNSLVLGGKIGYFLESYRWLGAEIDAYTTTPNIKTQTFHRTGPTTAVLNQQEAELRVTTVALNLVFRYPGDVWQPYAGGGPAGFRTTGKRDFSDSSTGVGFNFIAGLRVFVIQHLAVFGEYKYFGATFKFDEAFGPGAGIETDYKASHIVGGVSYHF
jgi:opacity protein-like surface antigen